jgi:hypothetical protein
VTRCPFCAQPLPCRCGQSAGYVCPKCGGDPHVGMARCPEERRAATARQTRRVREGTWCKVCGHAGQRGLPCLECGTPSPPAEGGQRQSASHPLTPRDGVNAARALRGGKWPFQQDQTLTWTQAMEKLRRRYVIE